MSIEFTEDWHVEMMVFMQSPLTASKIFNVLSWPPVTTFVESELKSQAWILFSCPDNVAQILVFGILEFKFFKKKKKQQTFHLQYSKSLKFYLQNFHTIVFHLVKMQHTSQNQMNLTVFAWEQKLWRRKNSSKMQKNKRKKEKFLKNFCKPFWRCSCWIWIPNANPFIWMCSCQPITICWKSDIIYWRICVCFAEKVFWSC